MRFKIIPLISIISIIPLMTACGGSSNDSSSNDNESSYSAEIRYTSNGIPHIKSDTYGGLGYGIAYAHARENICTLAEQIMKASGRSSYFFGPGAGGINIARDIGYLATDYQSQAINLMETLSEDARSNLKGYVAGYNAALSDHIANSSLPDVCSVKEWLTPINESQLLGYALELAEVASGRSFLPAMGAAVPPAVTSISSAKLPSSEELISATNLVSEISSKITSYPYDVRLDKHVLSPSTGVGSNGWGLGENFTESGNAMLLGNPHFPLDGELRFFLAHLTIPGEMDVMGGTVVGLPAVLLGFNNDVAWTHTVSQAKHFTFYQLALNPDNPREYSFDGDWVAMTSKKVSLEYSLPGGQIVPLEQDVYFSHYGPIIDLSSLSPALGWTTGSAITYRDANKSNSGVLDAYLAIAKAKNSQDILSAFADRQAMAWLNTVAIDKTGVATYFDITNTPKLSSTSEAYWSAASAAPSLAPIWRSGLGSILLPGISSSHDWDISTDSLVPGLTEPDAAPMLSSSDYVFNSNSSHWLTNVDTPLEGYSIVYGPERTERSPRTRYNSLLISSTNDLNGDNGKYSFEELKSVLTDSGSLFGDDFKDEIVDSCRAQTSVSLDGETVDITAACNALANWDGKFQGQSTGAHVMREVLNQYQIDDAKRLDSSLFSTPFSVSDPVNTPSGLSSSNSIPEAIARAVNLFQVWGVALDSKLEDLQYILKNNTAIPISGGYNFEGIFNMAETRYGLPVSTSEFDTLPVGRRVDGSVLTALDENNSGTETGAYRVNFGPSLVIAAEMSPDGPYVEAFLASSQSHDPDSENYADLTQKYSDGEWMPLLFSEQDIMDDLTETINLSGN